MAKAARYRKYSILAAICYACFTSYTLCKGLQTYSRNAVIIPILTIMFWILLVATTISLFLANKNLLLIIIGITLLYDILLVTRNLTIGTFLGIIPTSMLLTILILAVKGHNLSYLWYIPAVSRFDVYAFQWLTGKYLLYFNASIIRTMLFSLTEVVALLFIGIWLNMTVHNKKSEQ